MTRLLDAGGVSVGYGKATVVRDLDLHIDAGEVVVLIGPNGAGKTTTLLTAAGELQPFSGSLQCLGLDAASRLHQRARAGLGLVTDERAVFMRMTVRDNLKVSKCDVDEALRVFPELTDHVDRRVSLLSGGQQQMLALARALREQTRLVLADELSMGLAPRIVDRLLTALRDAADRGIGVLLVEQHVHKALEIADRVYVMERGRVSLSGPASDLRDRVDEIQASYLATTGDQQ
ncbi:MAG: ABC transporter ATP-binding protein [Ilumatobacteraceae bacterium]